MRTAAKIKAFGEELTAAQWVEDPRCVVGLQTLRARLRWGWEPEAAIARPSIRSQAKAQRPPWVGDGRRPDLLEQLITCRIEAGRSAADVDRAAHAARGWARSLEVGRNRLWFSRALELGEFYGQQIVLLDSDQHTVLAEGTTGPKGAVPILAVLRERRLALGWDRGTLAARIGIGVATFDHKESGRHDVLVAELESWAALVGAYLALRAGAEGG